MSKFTLDNRHSLWYSSIESAFMKVFFRPTESQERKLRPTITGLQQHTTADENLGYRWTLLRAEVIIQSGA